MTHATYLQASAVVVAPDKGNFVVRGVSITSGADAASVTLLNGGSGGGTMLVVKSTVANTTVSVSCCEAIFPQGIYAAITGTTPHVTIFWGTG